jgi:hypothetical protein
LLSNADEKVTRHPEVVTHRDTLTRANLELPLRRHDFSIDTADVHTSVQAGAVVSLDEVTSKDFASSFMRRYLK